MRTTVIGDALFTKTQQRVLGFLYGRPNTSFYTNEIVRLADMGRGTIRRELERLVSAGLLVVTREGNRLNYQANPDSPIFEDLVNIVHKISGLSELEKTKMDKEDMVRIGGSVLISRKELSTLANRYRIKRLNIFGSAARDELEPESDIDLMVEFEKGQAPSLWASQQLQDDFSRLFGGRSVDIASPEILRNPYRRKTIEPDLKVLYETN